MVVNMSSWTASARIIVAFRLEYSTQGLSVRELVADLQGFLIRSKGSILSWSINWLDINGNIDVKMNTVKIDQIHVYIYIYMITPPKEQEHIIF
jgi:hypothetical protein